MTKNSIDAITRWAGATGMAVFLGLMAWIGQNVSHIPVIEYQIVQIKENVSNQVDINVKRLDDHEFRLRILERRK